MKKHTFTAPILNAGGAFVSAIMKLSKGRTI